jgi:hypothetical protein
MTGDAGFFDADGHLKIIDRAKDVGKLANGAMFAPNYIENKLKFFPAHQGRRSASATTATWSAPSSTSTWARWATGPSGATSPIPAIPTWRKPEVYELIASCVEEVNADLAHDAMVADSQIHRFLILHKELDPDDDELTRTRKVRRNFVAEEIRGADRRAVWRQDVPVHRDRGQVRGWPHRQGGRRSQDHRRQDLPTDEEGSMSGERSATSSSTCRTFPCASAASRRCRHFLQCPEHEIRAIIGPNGAGKSSMLNVINGVYHPQEGDHHFPRRGARTWIPHQAAEQGIARTFQNIALFKGMSCWTTS